MQEEADLDPPRKLQPGPGGQHPRADQPASLLGQKRFKDSKQILTLFMQNYAKRLPGPGGVHPTTTGAVPHCSQLALAPLAHSPCAS